MYVLSESQHFPLDDALLLIIPNSNRKKLLGMIKNRGNEQRTESQPKMETKDR
jgi:hypothetical protein